MPFYECVFIARQDVSSAHVEGLTGQFSEIITEGGGQVIRTEYWGVRSMAYRIKKNRKGHYVLMNLDAPSDTVLEMERNMRLNEDVLRYLRIKTDAVADEPSVMMRRRDERGGRFGRERREREDRQRRRDSAPAAASKAAPAAEGTAAPTAESKAAPAPEKGADA